MKLTGTFVTICCGLALLSACKKSDNRSPATQKLQSGKWQIIASEATMNYMGKDTTINSYSEWRPCEQDDLSMYEDNGQGVTDENTNKCPEDDQTGYFTWELQSNDTKLKLIVGNSTTIVDIVELTDIQMKLKVIENDSTFGPVSYLETFKNIK